jgi:undecaprenyl-diphosphatase
MNKMISWIQSNDLKIFHFLNQRTNIVIFDKFMNTITHTGGATFTILTTVLLILFGDSTWKMIGMQALLSLAISHIPAAIAKKTYPRKRPYQVIEGTNLCRRPLRDHSFPSGHTTAIFSVVTPIVVTFPAISIVLITLALIVGISRIYLGLHYPTDVLAGIVLGTTTGFICSNFSLFSMYQMNFNAINWLS